MIVGTDLNEDGSQVNIAASVPLSEMFGYSTDIRSSTQGTHLIYMYIQMCIRMYMYTCIDIYMHTNYNYSYFSEDGLQFLVNAMIDRL
jgi:translation elongation factor EF-G